MGVVVMQTGAGARLEPGEVELLAGLERRFGRATLLAPTFAERDACRRELARAGAGLGIEVTTPAAWIASLWELFGDGRRLAGSFERQALIAAILGARAPEDIAPLRNNPGTVRLLARVARDQVPSAMDALREGGGALPEGRGLVETDGIVLGLLAEYREALAGRGYVEASEAAEELRRGFAGRMPACLRAVAVRDLAAVPAYVYRLLGAVAGNAAGGEVTWLLGAGQEPFADDLAAAFGRLGCPVAREALAGIAVARPDAGSVRIPDFLEVAGPHAKARAYADEALRLLGAGVEGSGPAAPEVVLATPKPAELFFELAPRLAAAGATSSARVRVGWSESLVGHQLAALVDLAARMEAAGADQLRAGEWWPAPELSDWIACPLSGADLRSAREFDKRIRGHRSLSAEQVLRELQSVQGRVRAARAKQDAEGPFAQVPVVCADVFQYIRQKRPVSALRALLGVARALPARAFGASDGLARKQVECALLETALEAVEVRARDLGVSQMVALEVLDSLSVQMALEAAPQASGQGRGEGAGSAASVSPDGSAASTAAGLVHFTRLEDAALLPAGSVQGLLVVDVDTEHYPLAHKEGLEVVLADRLGAPALVLEPVARQRALFARALRVPEAPAVLARVTHDGQARDRYPAALWTELRLAAGEGECAPRVRARGEGDIVADVDPASGAGLEVQCVSCLPPQELTERAAGYLLPTERAGRDPGAPLTPRRLSASQIESYCTCPLCWFMGSRVRPSALDAGFGGMEEGNFVHDVMARFHARLVEEGAARVTPGNVDASLELLEAVFAEVRAEHAQGKTSSSAPLVALSTLEDVQIDEILPLLRNVVRYEADALPPYHPALSEYSFDGQGVLYAGRPLGGRIDRVDVDGAGRAVVIDYKHRDNPRQFQLSDPLEPDAETGEMRLPAPDWLPEHQQALIYAQALRRTAEPLDTRGALYFSTKRHPAMCGAVDFGLVNMVPEMKDGFPGGGSELGMTFDELLDCVEDEVGQRLDALEAGCIQASPEQPASCGYNHALGFEMREA